MAFRFAQAVALGACLAIVATLGVQAHSYKLGPLHIGHLWAPPAAAGEGISIYGAILNMGDQPIDLVGATSPVGKSVRVRRDTDGKVQFQDRETFPPAKPIAFAKWREHLYIAGNKAVNSGDMFEMTLDFGATGKVEVEVVVENQASD